MVFLLVTAEIRKVFNSGNHFIVFVFEGGGIFKNREGGSVFAAEGAFEVAYLPLLEESTVLSLASFFSAKTTTAFKDVTAFTDEFMLFVLQEVFHGLVDIEYLAHRVNQHEAFGHGFYDFFPVIAEINVKHKRLMG